MPDKIDEIIDYEDDGTPVTMRDVLTVVAQKAIAMGKKLVIEDNPDDPDNPLYAMVDNDE